ncbi:MAG: hypothetical protein ACLRSW_09345 [Christensenellaceae bacterium]
MTLYLRCRRAIDRECGKSAAEDVVWTAGRCENRDGGRCGTVTAVAEVATTVTFCCGKIRRLQSHGFIAYGTARGKSYGI